jgi:hypothetical protein
MSNYEIKPEGSSLRFNTVNKISKLRSAVYFFTVFLHMI